MVLQSHRMAYAASTPSLKPQPEHLGRGCHFQASKPPSPQIKPIQIHHLDPGRDKVLHKLLLRIRAGVDLGQCP